jgi:hypothetical protein
MSRPRVTITDGCIILDPGVEGSAPLYLNASGVAAAMGVPNPIFEAGWNYRDGNRVDHSQPAIGYRCEYDYREVQPDGSLRRIMEWYLHATGIGGHSIRPLGIQVYADTGAIKSITINGRVRVCGEDGQTELANFDRGLTLLARPPVDGVPQTTFLDLMAAPGVGAEVRVGYDGVGNAGHLYHDAEGFNLATTRPHLRLRMWRQSPTGEWSSIVPVDAHQSGDVALGAGGGYPQMPILSGPPTAPPKVVFPGHAAYCTDGSRLWVWLGPAGWKSALLQ